MRGDAAEERMGRGARRVIGGIGRLISGKKKSKPQSTSRPRHRKHVPTEAERQGAYKEKLRKLKRS